MLQELMKGKCFKSLAGGESTSYSRDEKEVTGHKNKGEKTSTVTS